MTTRERQAYADQAQARIQALWRTRRGNPQARERLHYWVRVLRATTGRKTK